MAIQTRQLMSHAEDLAIPDSECSWRSAISRSYYAAFHVTGAWEKQLPAPGSNQGPEGGHHQQLINRLRNPAPEVPLELKRKSRSIAGRLQTQKERRVKADYFLDVDVGRAEVLTHIEQVRQLIADL
jgi:hypothetical protein